MRVSLVVGLALLVAAPSAARADDKGRFNLSRLNPFKKKEEPVGKSKQLADVLRTDPDEKKRKAAAEELRDTDPKQVNDVLPILVASLKQDPSAAVRATVAETLGKIKPVTASIGVALESAGQNDPSEAVRKAAQSAVWTYQASGYRPTNQSAPAVQTAEPPIAKPRATIAPAPTRQIVAPAAPAVKASPLGVPSGINRGPQFGETVEPPLAGSKAPKVESPQPVIPTPPMPKDEPNIVPPQTVLPAPIPLPAGPPRMPMPAKPQSSPTGTQGTIPVPPPTSNPGF
jgi:hypothetical protein